MNEPTMAARLAGEQPVLTDADLDAIEQRVDAVWANRHDLDSHDYKAAVAASASDVPALLDEVRRRMSDGLTYPTPKADEAEVRAQALSEAVASLRAKFGPTNRAADYLARTEQTKEDQ